MRRRLGRGPRIQIFCDVGYASFKRNFAQRGVFGDDVCLCAYNVQDGVFGEIGAELDEPVAHFGKRRGRCDVVAKESSVGT